MVITYHGGSCVKVSVGDTTIGCNPSSKNSEFKTARFGATVALSSLNHPDFNGTEQLSYGEKEPIVISGPGEYEVGGMFIRGIGVPTIYDKKERINTIYKVQFEDIDLCFLGAIHNISSLSNSISEKIGNVEILFLPIGGGDILSATDAYKVALSIEPSIIIPVHYDTNKKTQLDNFLKESGSESEKTDKLTIKKKDLLEKEGEVIVIKPIG